METVEGRIAIPEELLEKIAGGALSPEDRIKVEEMVAKLKGAGLTKEFCIQLLHPQNPADLPEFMAIVNQYYG